MAVTDSKPDEQKNRYARLNQDGTEPCGATTDAALYGN
jgi:hypothetical protein